MSPGEYKKARNAKYYSANRERLKAWAATYRLANKEKLSAKATIYYIVNRKRIRAAQADYRRANPGLDWAYKKRRRSEDPDFKLRGVLRSRVGHALKKNRKCDHTENLIGGTIAQWRAHLELLFKPGMTWDNHGSVWHIDHIKACVKFDLTDPAQQRACFHYTNTQPLFVEENLRKGAQ